jgi:hypothetical protein
MLIGELQSGFQEARLKLFIHAGTIGQQINPGAPGLIGFGRKVWPDIIRLNVGLEPVVEARLARQAK